MRLPEIRPSTMSTIVGRIPKLLSPLVVVSILGFAEEAYPEWRVRQLSFGGVWADSAIVATGRLFEVRLLGSQSVDRAEWPLTQRVRRIFWCRGDLQVDVLIKGETRVGRRVLAWAQARSDCDARFNSNGENRGMGFKVWFLREEGEWLRPVVDGGSTVSMAFLSSWNSIEVNPPMRRFATYLLTPSANTTSLDEFADGLWDQAEVACGILGASECKERMLRLARMSSKPLRETACSYLAVEFKFPCGERWR